MHRSLSLLVFILLSITLYGQEENAIAILYRSKHDGVWLRWAPTNAVNWQLGNKYGYNIERFTLDANGELEEGSRLTLTPDPIKPLPLADPLHLSERSDEVATLQELLYGEGSVEEHSTNDLAGILNRNNELQNRFGIAMLMCDLSLEAATAGGLFFKDAKAITGRRYIYRINIAHRLPSSPLAPSVIVVSHTEEKPLLQISDLTASFGDKSVTLHWPTLLHKGVYTAYYLERSSDGKKYTRLTDLPYIPMSEDPKNEDAVYVDSLEANLKVYYYRIQGITPFAELGPYSNIVKGEGKENLFGQLVLKRAIPVEKNIVSISWSFPESLEKQIAGFMISRAGNPDGPYLDITRKPIQKTSRDYSDQTAFNNTYYIVKALNKDGTEVTRSFPYLVQIEDNTPPSAPIEVTGTISVSGATSLQWKANTDTDLLGYRVFRSNSSSEDPVEVTTEILSNPYYIDTVNVRVLNKKVYYYIVAVDKNFNTSAYSNACELSRPDIIPPAEPVLTKAELARDSIILQWINSASNDVARTELVRVEKENGLKRVIRTWSPASPIDKWVDRSLTPGISYVYHLITYDSAGNASKTVSRPIVYEPGFRNSITNAKATVDRESKKIILEWRNPQPSIKCIVYRKINNSPLTIYKTLTGNTESFTDEAISINNNYSYKIQPIFSNGTRAMLSKEIKVIY